MILKPGFKKMKELPSDFRGVLVVEDKQGRIFYRDAFYVRALKHRFVKWSILPRDPLELLPA